MTQLPSHRFIPSTLHSLISDSYANWTGSSYVATNKPCAVQRLRRECEGKKIYKQAQLEKLVRVCERCKNDMEEWLK